MKKYNILDQTLLFKVCSKKPFRIMKLSTFLLFVTIFNIFGSKTYSKQNELLANTEIKDAVKDRQILLGNEETKATFILQQNKVTGIVTDKNGAPVTGVNVVVKGSTIGTMTDVEGKYTIEVPAGSKSLTFTFIGMEPQEINIGSLTQINVIMSESAIGLNEVVVVGYGTLKKVNLTGALAAISSKDLEGKPITNISSSLQGTMAGVTAIVNNGQPGKDQATIRVRGIGTLGNSDAMIVVDGIVGFMDDINPADIESITVLKDAASASIYGSRAANGVILITTKKGKIGDVTAHYNMDIGQQSMTAIPDFLDSWQSSTLYNEALVNEGKSPKYSAAEIQKFKDGSDPEHYPNTDWYKLFWKGNGVQQNHSFYISG